MWKPFPETPKSVPLTILSYVAACTGYMYMYMYMSCFMDWVMLTLIPTELVM
eukprot:COSAG03_NODE_2128_length_3095_cov_7.781709_1_plen_52_part_00